MLLFLADQLIRLEEESSRCLHTLGVLLLGVLLGAGLTTFVLPRRESLRNLNICEAAQASVHTVLRLTKKAEDQADLDQGKPDPFGAAPRSG